MVMSQSDMCLNPPVSTVDREHAKISWRVSKRCQLIWRCILWMSIFRWIYAIVKCTEAVFLDFNMKDFPVHITLTSVYSLCILWMYCCFIRSPDIMTLVVNSFVKAEDYKGAIDWKSLNLQEMLVLQLPFNIVIFPILYLILLLLEPDSKCFIYGTMSLYWESNWLLYTSILVEVLLMFLLANICSFSSFLVLMFLERCTEQIRKQSWILGTRRFGVSRPENKIRIAYRHCRQLQLTIQLFNLGFSYGIFLLKIHSIATSIVMYSFAILLSKSSLILTAIYFTTGIQCSLLFSIMFQKAFSIPVGILACKRRMLNWIKVFTTDQTEQYYYRSVRSIYDVGINVGSFHKFQRVSTPVFLDYVIKFSARVLIAFSKA
ncbi:unnamed protein product [Allacma fusca]|uniref:Uncharacterized protein n=1 Tax=Allacma fusca TaxID=39272 RepID=A0A8J2KG28_9HEXA|nr:unnamed protein product [Allacma fusca]